MIYARSLLYQVLFFAGTLVIATLYLPLLVCPRHWLVRMGRAWTGLTLWWLALTTGLTHEVRGRDRIPPGPMIYAFKHQSAWETLAMNRLLYDPSIVLKKELLLIPFFGWYLSKCRMIPVDRAAGTSALKGMVAEARRALDAGRPVVTFPEGTRTSPGAKARYHPGVFALYRDLGVSVIPVALDSGLFWRRREHAKRAGRITVEFLDPIPPGLSRKAFMAALEESIETATTRISDEAVNRHPDLAGIYSTGEG